MTVDKTSQASRFTFSEELKHSNGVRLTVVLGVVIASVLGTFSPPALAQSASLTNISSTTFGCMRRNTRGVGGWIEYVGDNQGRIRVFATGLGQVGELTYRFNPDPRTLDVTHVRGQVPFQRIRSGLEDTANKCRNGQYK